MEGVSCQQVGCYCVDFLPFYCKRCNYIYCLEHRSRFIHNCEIFNYNHDDDHDNDGAIIDIDECDVDYNTSNNDNVKKESVKDIMFSIENRFNNNDNAYDNNTTTATTTNNIKTSNASTTSTSNNNKYLNNTFTNKMNVFKQKLIQSKSQQAYNIALKTQEMLIKSKAIGNSNIAHDERYYLICNYHDDIDNTSTDIVTSNNNTNNTKATTSSSTASISSASQSNTASRAIYIFISKYKSISELLYYIIQNHPSLYQTSATTTSSKAVQQHQQQNKSIEQCHLVITTSDTPDWKEWNRNLIVKDVLRNYEEINIQLIDKSIVLENQHRLSSMQSAKSTSSSSSSIATNVLENNNHNQVNEHTTPYIKGQLLWYHKVPVEVTSSSTIQIMEEQQYMLLVKVIDVHHDDFPNIYYTIKAIIPTQTTISTNSSTSLIFEQEKQTDFYHLCTLSQHSIDRYKSFSSTPSLSSSTTAAASVLNKTNIKNDNTTAEQIALKNLQESLCKLGTNINLNVSHSNKLYIITVGSNCTISQLKILISATINISLPDMKLIYKGNILKNNHQKIIETKLINNSKIIVMSSNGK